MNRLGKIIIGGALLWYGVLRGARGLVVKVRDYTFSGLSLTDNTMQLTLNLLIKNPLLVGVTIKGVTGEVYAQGFQIGSVNTTYNYYIAGGKTHILPVIVNLNMSDVLHAGLMNIQSGDVRTLTIAFDGYIMAGKYNIKVPLQFELDYNDLVG